MRCCPPSCLLSGTARFSPVLKSLVVLQPLSHACLLAHHFACNITYCTDGLACCPPYLLFTFDTHPLPSGSWALPSRWAVCFSAPPSASTSRSGSTSAAHSLGQTVREGGSSSSSSRRQEGLTVLHSHQASSPAATASAIWEFKLLCFKYAPYV
jgi:hypothetical protein